MKVMNERELEGSNGVDTRDKVHMKININKSLKLVNYVVLSILIVLIYVIIYASYQSIKVNVNSKTEDNIYKHLLFQSESIEEGLGELYKNAELQRAWFEKQEIETLEIDHYLSFSWIYNEKLDISSLEGATEELGAGNIYVQGKIENISTGQKEEIARLYNNYKVLTFIIENGASNARSSYYSKEGIIAIYPYVKVENIIKSKDMFAEIKQSIVEMEGIAIMEMYDKGWETGLFIDELDQTIMFSKNWPIVIQEELRGVFSSNTDIEVLREWEQEIPYEGILYIVDGNHQIAYESERETREIRSFTAIDWESSNVEVWKQEKSYYFKGKDEIDYYITSIKNSDFQIIYGINKDNLPEKMTLIRYITVVVALILFFLSIVIIARVHKLYKFSDIESERLLYESQFDALTNIMNKKMLWRKLKESISHNNGLLISVIMIDIDDFKRINDMFGHEYGDKVLRRTAMFIKESVRQLDEVYRYGGEEFVVILKNTNLNLVEEISERIREDIENNSLRYFRSKITVSLGVAFYKNGMSSQELIELADKKMYEAKERGKNQVII